MTEREADFTDQAEEALHKASEGFSNALRERAAREAFSARGEPVEVTASDVAKARDHLLVEERERSALMNKLRPVFFVLGLICVLVGALLLYRPSFFGVASVSSPQIPFILVLYGMAFILIAPIADRFFGSSWPGRPEK